MIELEEYSQALNSKQTRNNITINKATKIKKKDSISPNHVNNDDNPNNSSPNSLQKSTKNKLNSLDYEQQLSLLNSYKSIKKSLGSSSVLPQTAQQAAEQSNFQELVSSPKPTNNKMNSHTSRRTSQTSKSPSSSIKASKSKSETRGSSSDEKPTSLIKRLSFRFRKNSSSIDKPDTPPPLPNNNSTNTSNRSTITQNGDLPPQSPMSIIRNNSKNNKTLLRSLNTTPTTTTSNTPINEHHHQNEVFEIITNYQSESISPSIPIKSNCCTTSVKPNSNFSLISGKSATLTTSSIDDSILDSLPDSSISNSFLNETNLNIETMAKVFNIFDRDRDGSITIDDVEQVMNLLSKDLQAEIEMPAIDQIKIAFEKFDENQNGTIEFEEFLNILKSAALQSPSSTTITPTTRKASPIVQVKSTKSIATNTTNHFNNTNTITLNGHGILSNMKIMFEQFDKDNDGRITKNELNFVMCNLFPDETISEQDINDMLKAADLDNNGYIDFEEFAVMFSVFNGNPQLRNGNDYELPLRNDLNQQREEFTPTYSPVVRLKNQKNSITTSNKSLNKSSSRSNSKDSRTRTRSSSQANSAANSPANFRKVVQIFTSSQMMDLKAAFTMFDKNGDQKISESELKQVMHYLGLKTSEDEVKAMIQVVDKNRNGYVDYDEFIQMMTQTQIKPLNADEELKKTFNIFDIDGNGYISHDEIKKTMEHLGENVTDEEVNDMIKAADKNGDGRIDINEFSGLLNGVTSRK